MLPSVLPNQMLRTTGILVAMVALVESYAPAPSPALRSRNAGASVYACEPAPRSAAPLGRRAAALPLLGLGGAALATLGRAAPAEALVKGVAPPEGYGRGGGKKDLSLNDDGKRITNKQEALEIGREREAKLFDKDAGKVLTTEDGDRYREEIEGEGEEVDEGSLVSIKYRVLRLGKRSRDGLSGEASLVFSYGYGEDDDKESDMLVLTVGETPLIPALESAIYGMKEGGKRRISVRPERGWRKNDPSCAGRDIGRTVDLGIAAGVPGGYVTETESCLDGSRVPAPKTFQVISSASCAVCCKIPEHADCTADPCSMDTANTGKAQAVTAL